MVAQVWTCALLGLDGKSVHVEVDIHHGLPTVSIVGLPGPAVREAKDRLVAGLRNSAFKFPEARVTFNLAPGDLPKSGAGFDLPMAVGLLRATDQMSTPVDDTVFFGELALDGSLRHCPGVLPVTAYAARKGFRRIVVPASNGPEAALVDGIEVVAVPDIRTLVEHLDHALPVDRPVPRTRAPDPIPAGNDLLNVRGQKSARRVLEVAAAGGHNLLFTGPPGAGKTMLARCLASILPPLSKPESLEVTAIYSVANQLPAGDPLMRTRPFRSPHHTVSAVALTGGGSLPRPGEVSLAHTGVLFLDELPEFDRRALESLRGPLEDRSITVARAAGAATFPARFSLIAARNPCPCGYHGDPVRPCRCPPTTVERYQRRLSGPLLDRIDVHLDVPPVDPAQILSDEMGEPSAVVRLRVLAARERQADRFRSILRSGSHARASPQAAASERTTNAELSAADIRVYCRLSPSAQAVARDAVSNLHLSARAFERVLKVARTVADMEGTDVIDKRDIEEALMYRARRRVARL